MARVPLLPSSALPAEYADVYETYTRSYGPFRNQAAVLAHVPPALDHLSRLLMELKARNGIRWRYVELAIVVASKLNACAYCVSHHAPKLRVEGLSAEAVERLPATDHPDLDEVDRLVIEYAVLVTNQPGRIRDAVFQGLKAHFTDAQVVELTLRIALCGAYNKLTEALQIDNELSEPEAHGEPRLATGLGEPVAGG
jgi:uncharacterized peroxidase-related enzyme